MQDKIQKRTQTILVDDNKFCEKTLLLKDRFDKAILKW